MRLHTCLSESQIWEALHKAIVSGHVASDVSFTALSEFGSHTHDRAFEVQLGVAKEMPYKSLPANYINRYGKRQKTRRTSNGGGSTWAATWHEWGWFILEVFKLDPHARWGYKSWSYNGVDDFHEKTQYAFAED